MTTRRSSPPFISARASERTERRHPRRSGNGNGRSLRVRVAQGRVGVSVSSVSRRTGHLPVARDS